MASAAKSRVARRLACRAKTENGFTLLELIVVCVLIGIMLSLGVPSLRMSLFTNPLKTAARKIIGLVHGARELAIQQQQPYLLHISQAESRIWYEQEGKLDILEDKNNELNKGKRLQEYKLPESVNIQGVWLGESDSPQQQTVILITKQGFMQQTLLHLNDDENNEIKVQFYPFLDSTSIKD